MGARWLLSPPLPPGPVSLWVPGVCVLREDGMLRFEITFKNIALPEEPLRIEVIEAEDQPQAMALAEQHAQDEEQIVGLAPVGQPSPR
jgi:hypothetical protein